MAENFYTELKVGGTITEANAVTILDKIGNTFTDGTFDINFKNPEVDLIEVSGDMSYNEFEEMENFLRKLNVAFTFTMYPRDDYPGIHLYNYPDLNLSGQTTSDSNGHSIVRIPEILPLINLIMNILKEGPKALAKHVNNDATKDLVASILKNPDDLIPLLEKEIDKELPDLPDLPKLKITEALT